MKKLGIKSHLSAFTLIELVVSIVISTIVLVIVFGFTWDTIANLVDVNRKSDSLQEVYRFSNILSSHKWKYIVPEIIVDNPKWIGHDVLYMRDPWSNWWVIWAVIDSETLQIEDASKYDYYGNKILWYRLLSDSELATMSGSTSVIYDYVFFEDKLFNGFKTKEFQLELYNSWALLESNIEIIPHYKKDLDDIRWLDIPKDDVIKININI